MKILTIIGARPQFVKAAVVSRELTKHRAVNEIIIHTGQHYDKNMSDIFFKQLDIPEPHFNLGVGGGTHGQNTGRMIEAIEEVMLRIKPDWVLVYGDTDSTLAGALAAVKLHIPVAHVEAGLRSFNRRMPEEINRILTDHAASMLFCPTIIAVRNLVKEGISGETVQNVGDVMYDAALYYGAKSEVSSNIIDVLNLKPKGYILATLHRQENTDDRIRLSDILQGFATAPEQIILPLHPRTKKQILAYQLLIPDTVKIIDPVGYLDMVMLEKNARMIATDSGGVQKEAYFHQVPCITLRDETEWVELVECGLNSLVGADTVKLTKALNEKYQHPIVDQLLYGNGSAGGQIVSSLLELAN